jgi:hypothetical protein
MLCLLTNENNNKPNHNKTTIGLSLSSVSKYNMWSYYDWVVVVFRQKTQYVVVLWLGCRCCLPSVNTICGGIDNTIIIRPHIVFTDGRQQRQPNHNMWRPHIVFSDGRQRQPNHNTTTHYVYWRTTTSTTQS